jgi:hypothetical protein
MSQEYSFTLTVPLVDLEAARELLELAQQMNPTVRISRKPNRSDYARFYLSFPFSGSRPDLSFQEWFNGQNREEWDLFGPTYGRWGLT